MKSAVCCDIDRIVGRVVAIQADPRQRVSALGVEGTQDGHTFGHPTCDAPHPREMAAALVVNVVADHAAVREDVSAYTVR